MPIDFILKTVEDEKYYKNKINETLSSKSMGGVSKAINVLKVIKKLTMKRADGRPKFLSSIEVDFNESQ